MIANLHVLPNNTTNSVVEYVRELLERCEKGEVIAITAVEELPEGRYQIAGSRCESRTRMAGMLLDAAIVRLNTDL